MTDGDDILYFERIKAELKDNGVFLTIYRGSSNDRGLFVVCDQKHQRKWRSELSVTPLVTESCPIKLFSSLEEVHAFAVGLCLGQNRKWKD